MAAPEFAPLFVIIAVVSAQPQFVGTTPLGYVRRIMNVLGGEFEGPRIRGRVLPGGSDAVRVRADGAVHLDVRLVLETEYDERIFMTYHGVRSGPPAVLERLRAAQSVGQGEDYFRTAIAFETGSDRLTWMNDIVAIGVGHLPPRLPNADHYEVVYEVFELK